MKKIIFSFALLSLISISSLAQEDKMEKKETQEIIIRKKGDKDKKITVEINGDKVLINGKPLSEYKDDEITVNKRKVIIRDRNGNTKFEFSPRSFGEGFNGIDIFNEGNMWNHAFLGVNTDNDNEGAKITKVYKESAAEKAGLKENDVITKVGDKKIDGPESLSEAIKSMKPKDEVKVYYKRDNKEYSTKAVLGKQKLGEMAFSFSSPKINLSIPPVPRIESWDNNIEFNGDIFSRRPKLGLKIQDTEEENGVRIIEIDDDSPAEKAGLKKDDVIIEIGGKKVSNSDEARELLGENQEKSTYNIKTKRNGSEMNFDIKIPKKLKTANL